MAFGPIASPAPNVLFNPLQAIAAAEGMQRNRLLMQQALMDREREEVGRVSASLLSLDPAARPQAYATARQQLARQGLAANLPEQFPGDVQVEQMARAAMPAAAQFQLAEKQRASQEMMALLGGMMPGLGGGTMGGGMGGSAPGAVPGPSAGVPSPSMPRPDYATAEAQRAALLGAPSEVLAANSAANSTVPQAPGGYRANPGVAGQFGGLPPPSGLVNPNIGGSGPMGLTDAQRAAVVMGARTNPGALPGLLAGIAQQNAMAQERALDNQRAERGEMRAAERDARSIEAERIRLQLARETAERQAAAAQRQEEVARRQARTAGLPQGWERDDNGVARRVEGLPDASTADATEAERKAAGYMQRMQGAESLLQDMVRRGYDPGNIRDRVAQLGGGAGNFLSTEQGQQYMNAAEEWARAKLRLESGAAIGKEEAQNEARTYFPMPGDSPATVAQKARLRETAVEGVRRQAGRAAAAVPQPAGPAGPDGGTPLVVPPPAAAPQRLRFNPATGRIE